MQQRCTRLAHFHFAPWEKLWAFTIFPFSGEDSFPVIAFIVHSTKSSCQAGVAQHCGGNWMVGLHNTHETKQLASQLWVEKRSEDLKKPLGWEVKCLEKSRCLYFFSLNWEPSHTLTTLTSSFHEQFLGKFWIRVKTNGYQRNANMNNYPWNWCHIYMFFSQLNDNKLIKQKL